jgi:hypothetical protein
MPTPKETYEYCEHLVQEKIDEVFVAVSNWSREYDDHSEEFISFKQRRSEELKELYKHLENIQSMKTSYLSGR